MIEITTEAQAYFKKLISQQDEDGLALRLAVTQAGTPEAGCDLQFCPAGQNQPDDIVVEYDGFNVFVARNSKSWLSEAQIDFEADETGGALTIKAPGIKGSQPTADSSLDQRVAWILQTQINPSLASHGGHVSLVEITEEKAVVLQFGGGCQGCGMADVTMKQGIEQTLKQELPEVTGVLDATDHQSGSNPYYAGNAQGESAV